MKLPRMINSDDLPNSGRFRDRYEIVIRFVRNRQNHKHVQLRAEVVEDQKRPVSTVDEQHSQKQVKPVNVPCRLLSRSFKGSSFLIGVYTQMKMSTSSYLSCLSFLLFLSHAYSRLNTPT